MLKFNERAANTVQNPESIDKVLFLNPDGVLQLKDSAGTLTNLVAENATGQSTARPFKVYKALLTQTGILDPVATVLENTLGGTVVWSRAAIGEYIGTLVGAFPDNKTSLGNGIDNAGITILEDYANVQRTTITRVSANELKVLNLDSLTPGAAGVDGIYSPAFISIEVYP